MATKRLILQIGRLEKNIDKDFNFIYEMKKYRYHLSSFAFKKHFGEENTRVILFYPISLIFNKSFLEKPEFYEINNSSENKNEYTKFFEFIYKILINKYEQEKYLKAPDEIFSQHPYSKFSDKFFVLNSLGNYLGNDFKTNLQDLTLYIWSILVDEYLENEFDEIYCDISTGLNFYISAFMEALRYFLVWVGLFNLDNGKKINGFIAYMDPVVEKIPDMDGPHLYIHEMNFKIFFQTNLRKYDLQSGLVKRIVEEQLLYDKSFKNSMNNLLENFLLIYSCFHNSIPLFLFSCDFIELDKIIKITKKFIFCIINKFKQNYKECSECNFSDFSKVIYSLGFIYGLRKIMITNKIYKKDYVSTLEIENFCNILKNLGLNSQESLLSFELYNNFKKNRSNFTNEWRFLSEYKENDKGIEKKDNSVNPRNFFAHAGFERTITMIKIENNRILIKYDESKLDIVKKLLLDRE